VDGLSAHRPIGGVALVVTRDVTGTPTTATLRIDQRLLQIAWHPGSHVPGGGGWPLQDQLAGVELQTVVATFNGGFTDAASRGGMRAGSRTEGTLRTGAASFVIDRTGRADIVQWGRDRVPADTVVVRQNLDLLIDGGRAAATVGQDDTVVWGRGLHHRHATWRTAAGITRSGDLVIVLASDATTRQLAQDELHAGAVRAMELDINPQFSCLLTYTHTGSITTAHNVLPQQQGSPMRYLRPSRRDFFSIRPR